MGPRRRASSKWTVYLRFQLNCQARCSSRGIAGAEKDLQQAEIGIIGGSGLYSMPGLTDTQEVAVKTPFGDPSDKVVLGKLEGRSVAFLARHGRGHRLLPR